MATASHEPGTERLTAFSDGVIAIAITLLILPLAEIEVPAGAGAADILSENLPALAAFTLSFAVIGNYWSIHHALWRPVRRHTPALVRLNLVWLACIVFLPFPTALIANRLDGGFATLYIATLLAASTLTVVITVYLTRHPELTDTAGAAEVRRHVPSSSAAAAALLVALLLSLLSQGLGMYALLLLVPAQVLGDRRSRRAASRTAVPGPGTSGPARREKRES